VATVRSSILDRKGRLEMSRKFNMISGLSPGFLRMGLTADSLNERGSELDLREEFIDCRKQSLGIGGARVYEMRVVGGPGSIDSILVLLKVICIGL